MQAIVYTRISLDKSGAGEGVARQRDDALELAARRGWDVAQVFEDNDVSASGKRTREGFEAMLAAIQAGGIGAVVAWNLDRLTRNRRDTVRLIETCQAAQVTIALVRGSDLDMTTPAGRLVADVLASVARAEIETKGDRQRRANLQRATAGKPHAGRRTYGYSKDGREVVEHEAALVRAGFEAIMRGDSLRSIARAWNAAGALSTAGNPWRPDSVRGVLVNPRYAARRYYNGDDMGPGDWPAIVDEDTATTVRAILTNPARSTTTTREPRYLLASLAECGLCDDGTKVATARTQHGTRTYKCHGLSHVSRKAEPIDEYVRAVAVARLSAPDAALLVSAPGVDLAALRADLEQERERQGTAASLYAAGAITAAQLSTITSASTSRARDLEARIATAGQGNAIASVLAASDVGVAWDALDVMARRKLLAVLFARIVIDPVRQGARTFDPESVRLEWKR